MRVLILSTIAALFLLPALATAQYEEESPWSFRGYMLYGNSYRGFPGGPKKHNLDMGADLLWKGLGAGLELGIRGGGPNPPGCKPDSGWFAPDPPYASGDNSCNVEVSLSANGSYYFNLGPRLNWLEPFVTAGYTVSTRFDPAYKSHFPNFGGGVDFWFGHGGAGRVGLRLEARDHLAIHEGAAHFPEFRIGVVLR